MCWPSITMPSATVVGRRRRRGHPRRSRRSAKARFVALEPKHANDESPVHRHERQPPAAAPRATGSRPRARCHTASHGASGPLNGPSSAYTFPPPEMYRVPIPATVRTANHTGRMRSAEAGRFSPPVARHDSPASSSPAGQSGRYRDPVRGEDEKNRRYPDQSTKRADANSSPTSQLGDTTRAPIPETRANRPTTAQPRRRGTATTGTNH